jgi:hypothetical protein
MTLREKRLAKALAHQQYFEEHKQEIQDKEAAAKRKTENAYARKLYAKKKKRLRLERIAKNKADKAERLHIRNEKSAEKLAKTAARLAAKNKPGPRLQAILDSYQGGLAAGWERGRLWERLNGPDVTTPDVL